VIAGLVLAAGASTRMGRQKLLLPVAGEPLVRRAVRSVLAGGLDRVVVVLGRDAGAVGEALRDLPVRTVLNPAFAAGQSTSLRAGLDAVGPVEAVVVALGDQPLPDPGVVRRLAEAFRRGAGSIVVPAYRDGRGHPVLLGAAVLDEARAVTGDRGARAVIDRDPARVAEVPVDAPAPADVDTPEDYQALQRRLAPGP
jgi:molybdenum cofactor cytidylyltransferase